jgi:hypothetical protein
MASPSITMSPTLEQRVAKLEEQHSLFDGEMKGFRKDLIGTADKPGVFETMRQLKLSMESIAACLTKLTASVDSLTHDRSKLWGIWLGAGALGSVVGFFIRVILSK